MYLKNLKIKNFRNYNEIDLDFEEDTIIITGDNGKGKTNLLESIYFISTGKSHRTSKQDELINWDSDFAILRATILEAAAEKKLKNKKVNKHLIGLELRKNNNIKIRVDQVPFRKKSDFISILPSVIFSPDDLVIIKGSPSNRRGFLDGVLEKIQKDYYDLNRRYQKILNQRNSLLKSISDEGLVGKNNTIITWNDNLVEYGSKMIFRRLQLFYLIQDIFPKLVNNFFPDASARIFYLFSWQRVKDNKNDNSLRYKYLLEDKSQAGMNLNCIKQNFADALKESYKREITYKNTIIGPHRDDFIVLFDNRDVRAFGSQGQQRIATICLRLCEIDILKNKLNKNPVLLLDDVLSELDLSRKKTVMSLIENKYQTFITTSNLSYNNSLNKDSNLKKLNINNNSVVVI